MRARGGIAARLRRIEDAHRARHPEPVTFRVVWDTEEETGDDAGRIRLLWPEQMRGQSGDGGDGGHDARD